MDPQDLLSISNELAEVGRLAAEDDVAAVMTRYVHRLTRAVPQCDAALIAVRGRSGFESVAGTWRPQGTSAREWGPIADALAYGEPRRLADTRVDRRWPAFADEIEAAGYRSALVLPVRVEKTTGAVLTLLSGTPDEFGEASFDLAQLLAAHAGPVLDNASLHTDCRTLVEQLRVSVQTRSVIGRAQGLLMAADDSDSERAFRLLRDASQRANVKLRQVAEELVDAHESGELTEVAARYALPVPGA